MLYAAHHGWARAGEKKDEQNHSRLFVSMEMSTLAIQQRLAALHTHVSATHVKQAALSSVAFKKVKLALTEVKGFAYPFWVVDGNLAVTVEDIWMIARQLNPGAIFVDGGYLLKHPTERDRYRRVAENAELIKQELAKLAPTVVSWQFAKSAGEEERQEGREAWARGYRLHRCDRADLIDRARRCCRRRAWRRCRSG